MSHDGRHGANGPASLFRWECPVCGKSGMIEADDQPDARDPLIRHLRYTEGDGHTGHNSIPDSLSIHALDDYIDKAA